MSHEYSDPQQTKKTFISSIQSVYLDPSIHQTIVFNLKKIDSTDNRAERDETCTSASHRKQKPSW